MTPGTMSFNPYQPKFAAGQAPEPRAYNPVEQMANKMDDLIVDEGNNDTKMSNNEAFLAYISKNTGDEDDE